ncbi:hypothetical protein [Tenacibaculum sp. SG-28]|uniref:hypothetical protein n=1 Tax=Tenacibaculum sp. SG-28 TaxID=754426 RepID=UPI000D4D16BD|nr:hypothetical protein [Tenacibaculum sp. SG-28]PQJ23253.1 hypothetical protein BSU00_03280 [Tenacibaculum sp. SG-28]
MEILDIEFLTGIYPKVKEKKIQGRWVTFKDIESILEELPISITKDIIGTSEQGIPIYKISFGTGTKKYCFGVKCTATKVPEPKQFLIL